MFQGCGGLSPIAPLVPLSELPRRRQAGAERAAPAGNATPGMRPAVRFKINSIKLFCVSFSKVFTS